MRSVLVAPVAALLLLAAGSHGVLAGEPSSSTKPLPLDAFAHSIPLTPRADAPVHALVLPVAVYRGVTRADLGDLRVFNAEGQQVPHAVRTLASEREAGHTAVPVPWFPLSQPRRDKRAPIAGGERLSVRIERDAAGAVIDLQATTTDGQASQADAGPPAITAYLLDLRTLDQPVVALTVGLAAGAGDYVLPVRVETSADLVRFRPVPGTRPLVSLSHGGQRIERSRVELPGVDSDFAQLRWPGHELPAPIVSLQAELGGRTRPVDRERLRAKGVPRAGEPGVYDFDLGGHVPTDSVRIELPEDNTLVQVTLSARATAGGAPREAFSGRVYRVTHAGQSIESPPIELSRHTDRHWILAVDGKGGGLGRGVPQLVSAHDPDQLLFVARGPAPFHLAYGHHAAEPTGFDAGEVLAVLPAARHNALPRSDTDVGEPQARAGAAALEAPPPPPPYRRYILWAVLIAGTALVMLAAIRLARGRA